MSKVSLRAMRRLAGEKAQTDVRLALTAIASATCNTALDAIQEAS